MSGTLHLIDVKLTCYAQFRALDIYIGPLRVYDVVLVEKKKGNIYRQGRFCDGVFIDDD